MRCIYCADARCRCAARLRRKAEAWLPRMSWRTPRGGLVPLPLLSRRCAECSRAAGNAGPRAARPALQFARRSTPHALLPWPTDSLGLVDQPRWNLCGDCNPLGPKADALGASSTPCQQCRPAPSLQISMFRRNREPRLHAVDHDSVFQFAIHPDLAQQDLQHDFAEHVAPSEPEHTGCAPFTWTMWLAVPT